MLGGAGLGLRAKALALVPGTKSWFNNGVRVVGARSQRGLDALKRAWTLFF